jgi:hypothetical protein
MSRWRQMYDAALAMKQQAALHATINESLNVH